MLQRLMLGDFVIVESSVLDLGPGLNVLTGETGAGKSILVDALGLLVGGRGSADWVRSGAQRLRLEAGFDVHGLPLDQERLEERAIPVDEDEVLLLQREISADGRSRSFINGAQVLVGDLRDLTEDLVRIVGQGDARSLLSSRTLEGLLDRLGDSETLAEQYRARRRAYLDAQTSLEETREARAAFEREEDWLRFQLQEIRDAELSEGERERLMAARDRVRDREEFERRARELQERLAGDDGSVIDHLESLAHLLRRAEGEPWNGLEQRLLEVRELVRDLIRDVPDPDEEPDIDLPALEGRLAQLDKLRRKYGDDEAAILEHGQGLEARLQEGDSLDGEEQRRGRECEAARQALADAAQKLSKRRRAAAKKMEQKLTPELSKLGMPHAQLALDFKRHPAEVGIVVEGKTWEPREGGLETISAAFRSHHEMSWSDLSRAASGGELSRVLLAVQVVVGDAAPIATWVFDEIDAGIGGETAQQVGQLLARLAQRTQVLLVTHLPAIAARADRHFKVSKLEARDGVQASVQMLEGEDRLEELARMLSGDERSVAALKHAEELLRASAPSSAAATPPSRSRRTTTRPGSRRSSKRSTAAPSGAP